MTVSCATRRGLRASPPLASNITERVVTLTQSDPPAAWALGLLVGIDMIFGGMGLVAIAVTRPLRRSGTVKYGSR